MTETETTVAVEPTVVHKDVPITGPNTKLQFDRRDDRRNKDYGATTWVRFEIDDQEKVSKFAWKFLDERLEPLCKRLTETATQTALADARFSSLRVSATSEWSQVHKNLHMTVIRFCLRVEVNKPSLIPANGDVLLDGFLADAKLGRDAFFADIRQRIADAIDDTIEDRAQEKRRKDAERITLHLAKEADVKAREVCRFEQRLEALKAELKAEQKVQLKTLATEMVAEGEVKDEAGEVFDQRSVEAGIKHAEEALPPALRGFFPDCHPDFVKKEEV